MMLVLPGRMHFLVLSLILFHALAVKPSNTYESKATKSFSIRSFGGTFEGTRFLADALTKDLPKDLQSRLNGCDVNMRGDWTDPFNSSTEPRKDRGRVWILVNGEPFWGDAIHNTAFTWLGPNDKLVLLGNWFNESVAEPSSDRWSSIWIPYASLYFADRDDRTPLDLISPGRIYKGFNERRAPSAVQQSIQAERIVAYLHTHCEERRETMWDMINEQLLATTGHVGSALGKCNGKKHLGTQVRNADQIGVEVDSVGKVSQVQQADRTYDAAEKMYTDFLFTLAVENEPNKVGYISEKIVNAFLAGSVPIYHGAAQIDSIFNPGGFLRVNDSLAANVAGLLQDPQAYEKIHQPGGGVVTDESLRRFFSWHPTVWPSHGDDLRQRIMNEVARLCSDIKMTSVDEAQVRREKAVPRAPIQALAARLVPAVFLYVSVAILFVVIVIRIGQYVWRERERERERLKREERERVFEWWLGKD